VFTDCKNPPRGVPGPAAGLRRARARRRMAGIAWGVSLRLAAGAAPGMR